MGAVVYMFTLEPKKKYMITTILLCVGAPCGLGIAFAYVFIMDYSFDGLKAYEYYGPMPYVWISWFIVLGGSGVCMAGAAVGILRFLGTLKPKKNMAMDDDDDEYGEGEDEAY
jgi:hypothetical protein